MQRLLFLILALFFLSPHVYAANCTSGEIYIEGDYTSPYNYDYDSSQTGPVAALRAKIISGFQCDPDYVDSGKGKSSLSFPITNGGTCNGNNELTTTIPGVVWRLEGLRCEGSSLRTNTELTVNDLVYGKATWSSGTILGRLVLTLTDDYWRQNTQTRTLDLATPTRGNVRNGTNVMITPVLSSWTYRIIHSGTCTMSVSPENVSFGTLSPIDINKGDIFKTVNVYWNCINKAIAANGLSFRFDPENVLNASQSTFSAIAKDGKKLNFKLVEYTQGHEVYRPISTNTQVYARRTDDSNSALNLRIKVLPSTPYPTGNVSTYLNITAIYR